MTAEVPAELRSAGPLGRSPVRRPGSVRRTSTLDMRYPDGLGGQLRIDGRARDLFTPAGGRPPVVLAEDRLSVGFDAATRVIEDIEATPPRSDLTPLVGARGGGGLRALVARMVPGEREAGTPLYLMLDDLAGASLIATFGLTRWMPTGPGTELGVLLRHRAEGVCTGLVPGSSGLRSDGTSRLSDRPEPVVPLPLADDPLGWHELEEVAEPSTRRARRIDVRLTDVVEIDAMFQDSATEPSGGRVAVHEYQLYATADLRTGELLSLVAEPGILPYDECPLAVLNIGRLIGIPLAELRTFVPRSLRGVDGCTHLNDAMRALAEVPALVAALRARPEE